MTEQLRPPGLSKVTGHICHQGRAAGMHPWVGCREKQLPALGQGQSTHIVGMPWICMGVGCWIPFFFSPLRIAVKRTRDTSRDDLKSSPFFSSTHVSAAALPSVENSP